MRRPAWWSSHSVASSTSGLARSVKTLASVLPVQRSPGSHCGCSEVTRSQTGWSRRCAEALIERRRQPKTGAPIATSPKWPLALARQSRSHARKRASARSVPRPVPVVSSTIVMAGEVA